MAKKIILGIGILIVAFLAYVAFQPAHYSVARETVIQGPPDAIFPYLNNSKKLDEWMPWKQTDPGVQLTFSGPEEGVGATTSWTSEGQMGVGKSVVIESITNQSVRHEITYERPMKMVQKSDLILMPGASGTTVRWSVEGENDFMGKLFGVVANLDKIVGTQFENGLARLKTMVEGTKPQ